MDAFIRPKGTLDFLTQKEIRKLSGSNRVGLREVFRRCALAVLNSAEMTDSGKEVLERHRDFEINVIQETRGIKLELLNAPDSAFVDGRLIRGIRDHLFTVLRDIVYVETELRPGSRFDLTQSQGITDFIYHILRNAGLLKELADLNLVVCWGGHSIDRTEYDYTKEVGHQLGLRGFNICTGCGSGAMKGPMKGATIGHAKQRIESGRYIGITEPGIIASESPNPIVNSLVVMPDIEKRLEAFVRIGHGFVIFPGGVGTVEEILYILGILMHPENTEMPFPLVFSGPRTCESYYELLDTFITETLGQQTREHYQIIIDDPVAVATSMLKGVRQVRKYRNTTGDAYYFNWMAHIETEYQNPFEPSHESMSGLALDPHQDRYILAANLRRLFSGIVAGNVKDKGIRTVEEHGPFEIKGDPAMLSSLDTLLKAFCEQNRMKLPSNSVYQPCYRITV